MVWICLFEMFYSLIIITVVVLQGNPLKGQGGASSLKTGQECASDVFMLGAVFRKMLGYLTEKRIERSCRFTPG